MITGILHASFITSDLVRARAFYEGVLGLRPDPARPKMSFDGVWYGITPTQQIHLLLLPNPEAGLQRPTHGGRDRHVALAVSDLPKLIERLHQEGIGYSLSRSGRSALFCRDPDGNALEFIGIQ
ncbi:MAG TPA: VOC family protein [Gallionella sp.]|nr:VOC family protein [Gallionella sp.]